MQRGHRSVTAEFSAVLRAIHMVLDPKPKEQGAHFGRQKRLTPPQITELRRRKKGALIKTLRADYQLSKASVYRYLNASEPCSSALIPSTQE